MKTPVAAIHRQIIKTGHNQGKELIGQGSYADVYSSERDPGGVDKLAKPISGNTSLFGQKDGLENDPYYLYLKLISTNERMSNNPYFPKVYDLKTFKGSDGKYTYSVNMEKLHKFTSLSTEEIKMLGNNLFTIFGAELHRMKQELMPNGMKREGHEAAYDQITHQIYATTFAALIDKALDRDTTSTTYIKDSRLKQAIILIHGLIKSKSKYEMTNDAHVGNIMVRRGPFIPQIVITDPVA